MQPLVRITALALLGILGIAQSGLPAFLGEMWARSAMFFEYQKVMGNSEAIELVLGGDLGCGYFTELEALNENAGAVTLAWVTSEPPLLLPPVLKRADVPDPIARNSGFLGESDCLSENSFELDPPPPRVA